MHTNPLQPFLTNEIFDKFSLAINEVKILRMTEIQFTDDNRAFSRRLNCRLFVVICNALGGTYRCLLRLSPGLIEQKTSPT